MQTPLLFASHRWDIAGPTLGDSTAAPCGSPIFEQRRQVPNARGTNVSRPSGSSALRTRRYVAS